VPVNCNSLVAPGGFLAEVDIDDADLLQRLVALDRVTKVDGSGPTAVRALAPAA
jgi:hypothetical protein